MNTQLKQRLDEKLAHFSDQRFAQVLDFVEYLENRDRAVSQSASEVDDGRVYLAGIAQTLSEWSSEADERAYRDL